MDNNAPLLTVTISADGTVRAIPGPDFTIDHMPMLAEAMAGAMVAKDLMST